MIISDLKTRIRGRTAGLIKSKGLDVPIPPFDLTLPPSKIGGHLSTNIPLLLAKKMGVSPKTLCEELTREFKTDDVIEKVEVAGPGFLNFWLKDEAFRSELEAILADKEKTEPRPYQTEKILIEFVSANPTGPLHIGHGRGASLGDSLARVFRYLGAEVTTEFYINDAGGQIRNLGLSMEARVKELSGQPSQFPEDGYRGAYVVELAKEAVSSGIKFKPVGADQMIFTEEDLAGFASARILKLIQDDLRAFDVHYDSWFPESALHAKGEVEKLIEFMKKKDLAYEQDGAQWFRASLYGDEKDRVLKKASEAPTYFASDIAYHQDKFNRGYGRLIDVWGADHHGYAQRLKGALGALGRNPEQLVILLNQMVSIKGGRLSKRAGDIISLKEVLGEVGKDAARFFFALRSPGSHFEFDLDLAKKQASDNPVYYVQYVHARCCSIFREAEKRGVPYKPLQWKKLALSRPLEIPETNVLLHLMEFERTVELCARDTSTHHLTVYLLELAGKYHTFYESCRVLEEDPALRSFRLDMVQAIRKKVAEGLQLLGVSAPEKL